MPEVKFYSLYAGIKIDDFVRFSEVTLNLDLALGSL